jgi:hypothetical protein
LFPKLDKFSNSGFSTVVLFSPNKTSNIGISDKNDKALNNAYRILKNIFKNIYFLKGKAYLKIFLK